MGFFNKLKNAASKAIKEELLKSMGMDDADDGGITRDEFEANKHEFLLLHACICCLMLVSCLLVACCSLGCSLRHLHTHSHTPFTNPSLSPLPIHPTNHSADELRKDIRMISGCADRQTSADVSNVSSFQLPDPAGRAGGACTSTLLKVLYADERVPEEDLSFTQVLEQMRRHLKEGGYSQIPQLTSMNPIDVETKFDLVPETATGVRRAVMIGINYVGDDPGELSGCWNDVLNMKKYIMDVHGFEEDNIVVLMDDGENTEPTRENIIEAYRTVVAQSEEGDAIFLHYSGHGTKLRDDNSDEADGYDEALVPRDFQENGMIRDDDLYEILVKDLADGVHLVSLMDCCHSGTIMDLPYIFKGDGEMGEMILDPDMNLDAFIEQITGKLIEFLKSRFS